MFGLRTIAQRRLASPYVFASARSSNRRHQFSSLIRRRRNRSPAPSNRLASAVSRPDPHEGVEETIVVSNDIRAKNAVMAASLMAFCFGVAWYSMSAVGQAGSAGSDDPLAGLRQEAAAAQEKQDREEKGSGEATEMLKKFQAGQYDPDKYEDDVDVESEPKRGPWWKFW